MKKNECADCGGIDHLNRRTILKAAGLSGISWLTPLAAHLARAHDDQPARRAKSLIVLWLEGAPSQLETFDPHPGTEIAAGSLARKTRAPDVLLGDGLQQTAEVMDRIALVRSVTSKEGDHDRAVYNIKTGFRPEPTIVHPSIGSLICHQLQSDRASVDIPRHVSILPSQQPARGGYLGDAFDAFKIDDPIQPVPDVLAQVDEQRNAQRIADLSDVVDRSFARGRITLQNGGNDLGGENLSAALRMMSSDQLNAFNVSSAPRSLQRRYGETAFGRACLAAVQLIQAGVRCVEVTLPGWDSHANNHEIQAGRIRILDPAFATLISDLQARDLLADTVVVCGGEFGRTPWLNLVGGRDHWPHAFSLALAGGGIRGGRVVGQTSPEPERDATDRSSEVVDPQPVANIHATILHALGINTGVQIETPVGRPIKICEGQTITGLFG